LRHVQDLLGHRSLSTTERYLRLTITDLKKAHTKFHPREQWKKSYKRSLSLGQDKTWCWQDIALAYFAAGDKPQYEQTLEFLRKLDEKAASETEEAVSKTRNERPK
jgi:integrase